MSTEEKKYNIKDALDEIASKITVHDSLMIVMITHGSSGGFGIRSDISQQVSEDHPNWQLTSLTYSYFGDYLTSIFGNNSNRKYAVMIVVNQACFSGSMMDELRGENRILISAADSGHGDNLIRHSYRDLYDFAERIRNHFGEDSYVGLRALYLMRAIEATVLNESHRGGNYHGISIFLRDEGGISNEAYH
jgi:hypothetical protein